MCELYGVWGEKSMLGKKYMGVNRSHFVVDENGTLMGFGSYGPFRPHAAYQYSVEHSIYVDARFRGRGLGKELLRRLIDRAKQQGYHMMIGVIDAENTGSIALHAKAGFEPCGHVRHAGYKFGRWLDLALYQLVLPVPEKLANA